MRDDAPPDESAERDADPDPGTGPSILVGLAVAAAVALGVVVAADVATAAALDARESLSSYDHPRNPRFRAEWARYTEPRAKAAGELRIVVVGNSMGFLREHADGSLAYPSVLRDLLDARAPDRPVSVLNWSVPGAGGQEMAVLTARALDHDPDLVIVMTYHGNFEGPTLAHSLLSMSSDAPSLVYHSRTRGHLSEWFKVRFGGYDAYGLVAARSGLLHAHRLLFAPAEFDTWAVGRGTGAAAVDGSWSAAPAAADADRLLREFPAILAHGEGGPADAPRLLFVEMPVRSAVWRETDRALVRSFGERARRALEGAPRTTFVSAFDLLPRDLHESGTHLRPAGHRAFAQWLLPHVERALR